jgi:hypothetical protein
VIESLFERDMIAIDRFRVFGYRNSMRSVYESEGFVDFFNGCLAKERKDAWKLPLTGFDFGGVTGKVLTGAVIGSPSMCNSGIEIVTLV